MLDGDRALASLPTRRVDASRARSRAGPVLLVGDAAGLVDPLSGDGIYEAFVSGRLAADSILSGDLTGYQSAPVVPPGERPPVPEAKLERVHLVLYDGVDPTRRVPERPPGDAAATRLVAWEAGALCEQDPGAAAREVQRSRRARRPPPPRRGRPPVSRRHARASQRPCPTAFRVLRSTAGAGDGTARRAFQDSLARFRGRRRPGRPTRAASSVQTSRATS